MESILASIKKLLGIAKEYTQFDDDIIMHINSVFMTLTQLGVGPSVGFFIEDDTAIWGDFIEDPSKLQAVKSYVYLKVKLLFDPPLSSSVIEATNRMINEYEWRLNVEVETTGYTPDDPTDPTDPVTPIVGTTDYRQLKNLPKINGTTLIGNYDEKDPTVVEMSGDEVEDLWNEEFDES